MNSFYQNVFTPAVKRTGLEGVRFHDLRHTYASLMLTLVQSPYWISEQLGHADHVITLRRNTRLIGPKDTTRHPLSGKVSRPTAAKADNVVPISQRQRNASA
jgi:integrase